MPRTHFFAVGVGEYASPSLNLTKVDASIDKFAAYVLDNWPDAAIDDMADLRRRGWDHEAVEKVLGGKLSRIPAEGDTVIVYWVGHGDVDGDHVLFLTPSGSRLLTRQLTGWLFDCPAQHVVLVLDCCWAQAGIDDMVTAAVKREVQDGPDACDPTITVLVSARRNERATDGALVEAMMEVLGGGPPTEISANHRWRRDDAAITAEQLAAAVNAVFESRPELAGQRTVATKLRAADAGRVFPSPWFTQHAATGENSVPPNSEGRRRAIRAFEAAGLALPSDWTRVGLEAHRSVVAGIADDDLRAHLGDLIDALNLALDAESLAQRMLGSLHKLSEAALKAALRCAVGQWAVVPSDVRFNFFHAAAQPRGSRSGSSPVRAVIAFVARLAREMGSDPRQPMLYDWAAAQGREVEPHVVNKICDTAELVERDRRLVIDLGGGRLPEGALPTLARAQIYEEGQAVGDPIEEAVEPVGLEGTANAIARLVDAKRAEGFGGIDVVVPESLLFLEPETVSVARRRWRRRLVQDHDVALRYGGRLHPETDWEKLVTSYQAIVSRPCQLRSVDAAEFGKGNALYSEVLDHPTAVAFATVPTAGEHSPAEALLAALDGSPIVVWPVIEPGAGHSVAAVVEAHWSNLPADVSQARRSALNEGTAAGDNALATLRVVWEDEKWLSLASGRASYEFEG